MVRFVIVAAARTGSTMLRLMLNSHPDICSHGEVFSPDMNGFIGLEQKIAAPLRKWLIDLRDRDPRRFLEEFVFNPGSGKAVGFKIQYGSLRDPRWEGVLGALATDTSIRIVHLTRRNRLKRLVSHRRAMASGVNVVVDKEQLPKVPKIVVRFEELAADVEHWEAEESFFRQRFQHHPKFEIVYKDILRDGGDMLAALQRFLVSTATNFVPFSASKIVPYSPAVVAGSSGFGAWPSSPALRFSFRR